MEPQPLAIACDDGFTINGHLWAPAAPTRGTVIIAPATGVLARYYHRYARFLVGHGFAAVTFDYRGIGQSRPPRLAGFRAGWRDWGERDLDAIIRFAREHDPDGLLAIVGHSIGGVLVGFAESAARVDRILTVGAQHAYWRDYAADERLRLALRWHVLMPVLARVRGYFPGRRLGWLEDLPAGVAREWSMPRPELADRYPAADRAGLRTRFAAVPAPILAIGVTDDPYGTEVAIRRALAAFSGSRERRIAMLTPASLGETAIGHFALFHSRFATSFWPGTVDWIASGRSPWDTGALEPA